MDDAKKALYKALAAAQAAMKPAAKLGFNPHFKSKFAPYEEVVRVVNEAFHPQGLCWSQIPTLNGAHVEVITTIRHQDGGEIEGLTRMRPKDEGIQSVASAFSYCKRYGLASLTGVASTDIDDDGDEAHGSAKHDHINTFDMNDNGSKKALLDTLSTKGYPPVEAFEILKAYHGQPKGSLDKFLKDWEAAK